MERITDGIRMRTEFQKPTLIPLHSSPVQAEDHALVQASKVKVEGSATMLPSRISSIGLREVTTMIQSGSRKNRAAVRRKAYSPTRPIVRRRGRRPCGSARAADAGCA